MLLVLRFPEPALLESSATSSIPGRGCWEQPRPETGGQLQARPNIVYGASFIGLLWKRRYWTLPASSPSIDKAAALDAKTIYWSW